MSAKEHNVLITGAASGLGRAMALGLLEHGYRVAITDRAGETLESVKNEAAKFGDRVSFIAADLSSAPDVEQLADTAIEQLGQVDILINNAGIGSGSIRPDFVANHVRFWEHTPEHTRRFFQINVISPFRLIVRLVDGMKARKWGRIVNVTTSLDTMLREGMAGYSGSKAGLEAETAVMAKDLAGTGVTANILVPGGPANTPIIPDVNRFDRSTLIQPDQMVAPILWLASTKSDGVTGRRYASVKWDRTLPDAVAEQQAGAPVAWSGYGVQSHYPKA